jgi:Caspase domain
MARRALILANSRYSDETIPVLASPVSDSLRLKALLEREEIGGYQVTVRDNDEMMAARMAVHDFFQAALPGDLHLMVYSGHGLKDARSRLYFATADTQRERLAATALSANYIRQQIDDSRAGQKLLFIDACYSGTFIEGMTPKRVGEMQVSPSDFGNSDDKGTAIVTASTSVQLAGEREFDGTVQSVFTRCLIEGIETGQADASGDGMITLMELFDYVRERMRTEAPGQTPHVLSLGNGVSMPVARNPMHRKVALPKELLALARSKDRVERGSAVEDLEELAASDAPEAALAMELLRTLTQDDSLTVRGFAEAALVRLAGPKKAVKKESPPLRTPDRSTSRKTPKAHTSKSDVNSSVDKPQVTQTVRTVTHTIKTVGEYSDKPEPSLMRFGWVIIALLLFSGLWSVNFFFAKNQSDSENYLDATAAEAAAAPPGYWVFGAWAINQKTVGCALPITIRDNGNSTLAVEYLGRTTIETYTVADNGKRVVTSDRAFTLKPSSALGTEITMTTLSTTQELSVCRPITETSK